MRTLKSIVCASLVTLALAAGGPAGAVTATASAKKTTTATARCHDAKGHFIKCGSAATITARPTLAKAATAAAPPGKLTHPMPVRKAAAKMGGGHCRNAKGQFAKCGTPGAHPA